MKILIVSDLAGKSQWYEYLYQAGKRFDVVVMAGNHTAGVDGTEQEEQRKMVEKCVKALEDEGVAVLMGVAEGDKGWPWLEGTLGFRSTGGLLTFCRPPTIKAGGFVTAWQGGRSLAQERGVPFGVVTYHSPDFDRDYSALIKTPAEGFEFCFCGQLPPSDSNDDESSWLRRNGRIISLCPGYDDADSYIPRHIVLDLTDGDAIHFSEAGIHRIILNQEKP